MIFLHGLCDAVLPTSSTGSQRKDGWMQKKTFFLIFTTVGLFFLNTGAQAKGNTSVMFDTKLDKATLWYEYKRKLYIGLGIKLDDKGDETELTPALRYYVTSFSDIQVFAGVEMPELFDEGRGKGGRGKKPKKDDSFLGDIDLVIGAEYFFHRNFSIVAHFHGGGGINFQYYF